MLDGEIVALDGDGLPAFHRLQNFEGDPDAIVFYAFDLPLIGGLELRRRPLEARREMLHEVVAPLPDAVRFSETFDVPAARLMQLVREKGLEGIVAKRVHLPGWQAIGRLGEGESESGRGIRDRRLCSDCPKL